ncbi:hypothetical protein JCM15519_35630 [Fundidesulfovibrio butyratiphilus]
MTRAAVFVLLLVLSTACTPPFSRQSALERHFYALSVTRPQAEHNQSRTVLKVRPFKVSPDFQGKDMVYRLSDARFESDYYNAFFVAPAPALAKQTELWLSRSGLFGHVVDSTSQLSDTYVLEALVNAVYGDFRDTAHPKAVLEIQFFLLKNTGDTYQVAFSGTYTQSVPFSANMSDASRLAEAYNTALTQTLNRFEADLRAGTL